jgi:hypothetical protein
LQIVERNCPRTTEQNCCCADRQHRKEADFDDGEALDALVAAAEEERECDDEAHSDPKVDRDRGHEQVQHLRHAAIHASDLQQRQRNHQRPRPNQPVHAQPRARQAIEPLEGGVTGRNRVSPELPLDDRLDRTAQEDDPEHRKPHLRTERCRRNELPRADDRSREHHARADTGQRRAERRRRRFDRIRCQDVGILGHC